MSTFLAPKVKPDCDLSARSLVLAATKSLKIPSTIIVQPLIPYKSRPDEPKTLPEKTAKPSDEQIAQCQAIFDQAEARRATIEQKAQWTFTIITFLFPSLASVLVLLPRDPSFRGMGQGVLLLLSISACSLLLSFVSALRALAIRGREDLYIGAVIDDETGKFRKYDKIRHAQGLLYCANMNTATNDHIAQFVRGAHVLVAFAVVAFALGAVAATMQLAGRTTPPVRAEVVGAVSLSSPDISGLRSDVRRAVDALAARAAATVAENQMKILSDRVGALEAEVISLRGLLPVVDKAESPSSRLPSPPPETAAGSVQPKR